MLHCKPLNESSKFEMKYASFQTHLFLSYPESTIACHSAIVDPEFNRVDPALVPDGAKCATGKMCLNQKCMLIDDLRKSVSGSAGGCPNNCGGNGVCNSLSHCHCNRGFRPPECVQPGYGGSIDSGPAEDPNGNMVE